jgi:MSHA biogenesis protein MshK
VLIAPNRHVAIISGQTVALNGKYGEQTLIKMSETEVVLRNGKELQTLKLFPDFDKKLVRASGK